MKTQKQLKAVYDAAKGDPGYYTFENFMSDAKNYIKDIKKRQTVCAMTVSASGMTRKFNYKNYNMLFNICYNQKFSLDEVKVGGCGMDMHWNLQHNTCIDLMNKSELEKYNINYLCSSGYIL
jgi:hypothetical protein